ncbi:hypothetical protein DFQ05_2221 [Winogradskyella wandonensis]|uniref:Uncharacterized protein n=1 Tax=Winogradskyella wandonensis TaxID=1442586 RepID=A0A4R1KML2_9FLAO|nr:hypothetical protein [Winogradskyella wandonensis]TCK65009.1 hypothetical protein DFQ05_2221 [Winogradskyella wandonensis]
MKKIVFILIISISFLKCVPAKKLQKEIDMSFSKKYSINKNSYSSKVRNKVIEKYFNYNYSDGQYILIQDVILPEISGSIGSFIAIKNIVENQINYFKTIESDFTLNENLLSNVIEVTNLDDNLIKNYYNLIFRKIENGAYKELINLHKDDNRQLSHPGDVYVIKFSIDKDKKIDINKILLFQEFGVLEDD